MGIENDATPAVAGRKISVPGHGAAAADAASAAQAAAAAADKNH